MKKIILIISSIFIYFIYYTNTFAAISISPLKYELEIEQWQQIIKSIKVTNASDSPITLYTSSEDFIAWNNAWQPKFIKQEDQKYPELSLANWIELNEKNITLSPWETREVDFTIKVPDNWEPGWHYGAVFFSSWIQNQVEVWFWERIWVLILINVPWDIVIDWDLEKIEVWVIENGKMNEKGTFDKLPLTFRTRFKNKWNIHLKPKWKIELIDEDGNTLGSIWKETIVSPNWTYVWEKLVDYIPINSIEWNVLPKSDRVFTSSWEWFWYSIINDDWTRWAKFKTIEEYYLNKWDENKKYLMFRETIHIKEVTKQITAKYILSYQSKDINTKNFEWEKRFYIKYKEKYIDLNYLVISIIAISSVVGFCLIVYILFLLFYILPKKKKKREKEIREEVLNELKNK